jgi:hypothetical protein
MPTQVVHPRRASWRTFLQTLLALLPTANAILLSIETFIAAPPYSEVMPGWVFAVVNGSAVTVAFLAKIVAQIMANPVVNAWIEKNWPLLAPSPPPFGSSE